MSGNDNEDDKPTVVLDLNALKKKKQEQEDSLANIASELEFGIGNNDQVENLEAEQVTSFSVIYFDFQSTFFESTNIFVSGYQNKIVKTLEELNQELKNKEFQIVVFNYDANPKAVNQLCAQIKQKKPFTKTIIVAKSISKDKAIAHSKTPSGANGYISAPLSLEKFEQEFQRIYQENAKAT